MREGDWTMSSVDESAVPPAHRARQAFMQAMDAWDEPAADAAVTALARTAGAGELFDLFCRYGARDFRSIGHKAIYVANAWRTLQAIGWQHAEPIFRSLAYALLNHQGDPNPAASDLPQDRPWRENQKRATRIDAHWQCGHGDTAAAAELLGASRQGSPADSSQKAVELLNDGLSPASCWDALFIAAGELLLRQPGIIALHAMTTTNAMHYLYQAGANDETRRLLLLQNAAFLPMFRETMTHRGKVKAQRIDQLEPLAPRNGGPAAIEEIFSDLSSEPLTAARKVLAYLDAGADARPLVDAARRLVFLKGNDPHAYKFSSAVLEDYVHTSSPSRNRFLAASTVLFPGAGQRDSALTPRIRAALQS
jgi:hypothetical protein